MYVDQNLLIYLSFRKLKIMLDPCEKQISKIKLCHTFLSRYNQCKKQGSIGKYPIPGGKYQPMSFRGKNMKRGREKGENVKEKGRKGKGKEERGKERKKGERK